MIVAQRKIKGSGVRSFFFNPNKEIDFRDEIIIVNNENSTKVFSSRCTHLGCKINKVHNGHLQCPCHGSAFDLNGNATKGPAINPLKHLGFDIDKVSNTINVEL
jgi:Rieske Fe-S protein